MAKAPIKIYNFEDKIYYRVKDLRGYAHMKYPVGQKCSYKCGWQTEDLETYFTDEKSFTIKKK